MGLTGTRIILRIEHPSASVGLHLTYRWWTSDADPWLAVIPGVLGANGGTWGPDVSGGIGLWGKDREGMRRILLLSGTGQDSQPFAHGQEGRGEHFGVGGKIPGIPTPSRPLAPGRETERFENLFSGLGIGAPVVWKVRDVT